MTTIPHSCVEIQTTETNHPSVPAWFAEIVLIAAFLRKQEILQMIAAQVRLVRGRFGHYEVIDFLALLFGYALSGERTLQAFFTRLQPFAGPFMALFERGNLPHRSTLSRFLADIDEPCLDALRTLFATTTFQWGWTKETIGGIWDRTGNRYVVFDIDGTRETARKRKVPTNQEFPADHRRLEEICGPGYTGHRRGEIVRTRTTVLQMHTRQWLGSFGGRGNGDYQAELQAALQSILTYLTLWEFPPSQAIVRVDGQYGDGVVIAQIVARGGHVLVRKRGNLILEHPRVQAALAYEPTATIITRESQVTYELFDLPEMILEEGIPPVRLLVIRRAWKGDPISVGKVMGQWVYEQFVTTLPVEGFLATDILDLYQGRGAFEGTLADEDREGDPDRWCSLTPLGQEAWQVIWQWVWNLRLALSAEWTGEPLRSMEWSASQDPHPLRVALPTPSPKITYGPLEWARSRAGRLDATAFVLQEDGKLRCPQGILLWHSETRQEGELVERLIFTAYDPDCQGCSLNSSCLGPGASGKRGRRITARRRQRVSSFTLTSYPPAGEQPIVWKDVAGRHLRRTWMAHWREQTVTMTSLPAILSPPPRPPRPERSHWRLSWFERLGRNAREPLLETTITLTGVAPHVAALFA